MVMRYEPIHDVMGCACIKYICKLNFAVICLGWFFIMEEKRDTAKITEL